MTLMDPDVPTAAAEPPRPYHKGNVAEDLLKAAMRIMQTERVEDISIRRLSRDVGVTPGNFYNHFESLEDLLFTLGAQAYERRTATVKRMIKKEKSRRRLAVQLSIEFVEAAVREPELFRVMFGQIAHGSQHKLMGPAAVRAFRTLVEAIYGEDRYRLEDLAWSMENCQAAYTLFSLEYGLARNILEKHIRPKPNTAAGRARVVGSIIGSFVDGSCADAFEGENS